MNIVSSELNLASAHRFERVETVTERLEIDSGGRRAAAEIARGSGRDGPGAVVISSQGRALAAADPATDAAMESTGNDDSAAKAIESAAEQARKDPTNQLLIALVEHLTGRRIRLMDCEDLQGGPEVPQLGA
jgi:hypothetical protein